MRVVVMEDYQRAVERLERSRCSKATRWSSSPSRPETAAERAAQIGDAEALVLIRERTPIDARVARASPQAEADLPDRPGNAPRRPGGVHPPWNRRLYRRRVGAGACRARRSRSSLPRPAASSPTLSRSAPARGRRPSAGSCTDARSGSSATGTSVRSSPATRGARDARARLGTRGLARARRRRRLRAGAGARCALRALRRRQRPPQVDPGDTRSCHSPASLADEAGRPLRQHGPRRVGRARRARRRARLRAARGAQPSTCSTRSLPAPTTPSSRATPCSRPRTSGTSRGTRTRAYFSQAFAQVVAFAAGAPIDVANPEALAVGSGGAEPA